MPIRKDVPLPQIPDNLDPNLKKFYTDILQVIKDLRRESSEAVGEPCQLVLNTYAGYGSTDTKIMRFTNKVEGYGNAFSENHTSGYSGNAKGLEITINKAGKYGFSFSCNSPGSVNTQVLGFSKNSTELTTSLHSISVSDRLAIAEVPTNGYKDTVTWIGYLLASDVIRAHAYGSVPAVPNACHFTATYLGS